MKLNEINWAWLFAVVFIIGLWSLWFFSWTGYIEKEKFCEQEYPPKLNERYSITDASWPVRSNIQPGYVKCCRALFVNHELTSECEIIKEAKE